MTHEWRPADNQVRGWLLFLIAFTVPLRDQSIVSMSHANVRVGDVFIILGFFLVTWDLVARERPLRVNAVDLMLLTFVAYTFVSLFWALDLAFGLTRVGKLLRDLILYVVLVHELRRNFAKGFRSLAYGAAASFIYLFGYLSYAIAFGKVSLAKLAAAQLATSSGLAEWRDTALGGATFGGGTINALGMWSSVVLLLWIGAASERRGSQLRSFLFWGVAIAIFGMTLATLSRGVWLGTAVAMAAWFVAMRGRLRFHRWALILATLAGLGGLVGLAATPVARLLVARVNTANDPLADASIVERFRLWAAARELVRENPAFGVGAGGTIVGVPAVSTYKQWFVHNMYFQLSAEFGVVGLLVWVAVLVVTVWRLLVARHSYSGEVVPSYFRMSSATGAGIVLCLVIGLTGLDFSEMEWWVLLAVCATVPIVVRVGSLTTKTEPANQ
jgi:O-antigen ligase